MGGDGAPSTDRGPKASCSIMSLLATCLALLLILALSWPANLAPSHCRLCFYTGNLYCAQCHSGLSAVRSAAGAAWRDAVQLGPPAHVNPSVPCRRQIVPLRTMLLCDFESVPVCDKAYSMLALHVMLPIFSVTLFTEPPYLTDVRAHYMRPAACDNRWACY